MATNDTDAALPQALFVPVPVPVPDVPMDNMRSKTMQENSSTGTMNEKDPNQKFTETVERIVRRVAMQEGREHMEPSQQKQAATRQAGQGPLTVQELSELSLLCTVASAMPQAASPQHHQHDNHNSVVTQGFATVDGDQLVALLELLDQHVNLAARVHLIQDAINVMHQQESPSKASASLDQVRVHNDAMHSVMDGLTLVSMHVTHSLTHFNFFFPLYYKRLSTSLPPSS
jgi:hypothetical protein